MTTLTTPLAPVSNALYITLTAGAGETVFEYEFNRSADFSSDQSLTVGGLGAGAHGFAGLPANTPFYVRARSTNTTPRGPWSNVILLATAPGANPTYSGYSIEPAVLVVPEAVDQIECLQTQTGSSAENLLNDDPLSVLRIAPGASAITFHTAGRPIDTFALLGALTNIETTFRLRGAATKPALTSAPLVDTGVVQYITAADLGRRAHYHSYRRLSQTYTHQWWRIDIVTAGVLDFFVRHLVVGLARQSVNYSRGAGQSMMDFGSMGRTQFGAPDRVEGWRGRQVDFQLSWLSEAEYQAKWADLETLVGATKPVLALPNSKANVFLNDRIAFGDIVNARGENVRDAKWTRTLEIRSLY